jgi:hypothetical protein
MNIGSRRKIKGRGYRKVLVRCEKRLHEKVEVCRDSETQLLIPPKRELEWEKQSRTKTILVQRQKPSLLDTYMPHHRLYPFFWHLNMHHCLIIARFISVFEAPITSCLSHLHNG